MKKEKIRWMLSLGLLSLLGFAACSPRLRTKAGDGDEQTQPADTLEKITPGEFPPIRLMYGVPPARFEVMELPDSTAQDSKKEIQ